MRPIDFLLVILAVLTAILLIDRLFRRRRARLISGVGTAYGMNYSPLDRFAITERLMTSPRWQMRASDLAVKDVLYASRQGVRCFVATVKCRWSFDQDPSRFIVRILEPADHQSSFDLAWEQGDAPHEDADRYRRLLADWQPDPLPRSASPS